MLCEEHSVPLERRVSFGACHSMCEENGAGDTFARAVCVKASVGNGEKAPLVS